MDLYEKIRTLPTQPGVYLYKNAEGEVIYVGKAKNLRSRVRSYLLEAAQANAKTGSLMREAVDLDYILVANEHEALALENNLIKQRKPRFNILLRDDKTYPYVKLTLADRFPKVFVTRRLRKDGAAYYGPYFPGNLAYRVVELIHRSFLIPSCKVDLSRYHPRACLQYYIHRCLGPCVEGLTTPEAYKDAVRDAQLFLEGRHAELERTLTTRMMAAAEAEQFEAAARLRDQLSTVHQLQEKQRIATAEQSDDADVFGYHFEDGSLAVNLFHMRGGKIVDRREFFWEDLPALLEATSTEYDSVIEPVILSDRSETKGVEGPAVAVQVSSAAKSADLSPSINPSRKTAASAPDETAEVRETPFHAGQVFSALLKQLYIDQHYIPRSILVPVDFDDREALATLLTERTGHRIEIAAPQRGEKRSLVDLASQNAKQSYTQRFRVLEPSRKAIQEALADVLMLPELPRRIECFDISHIQGAETVASLVVWEDGKMNKSAYRKFKVMTVLGVDDFASMREVVERRYRRIRDNIDSHKTTPGVPGPDSGTWESIHSQAEGQALKGHDFSRAKNRPPGAGALAPEAKPGRSKGPNTMPSLVLIDGGLGQLHAAADALESLGFTSQPLASIAKKEEIIYVYGNENEPVVLDRRSPVLHLIQLIRDESHRFAIGYHRQRRAIRDRASELLDIPGVGPQTRQRLLTHFGSLRDVQQATAESLAAVVPRKTAETIWRHFHETVRQAPSPSTQ
jgi:excinuclease ABC subunit C